MWFQSNMLFCVSEYNLSLIEFPIGSCKISESDWSGCVIQFSHKYLNEYCHLMTTVWQTIILIESAFKKSLKCKDFESIVFCYRQNLSIPSACLMWVWESSTKFICAGGAAFHLLKNKGAWQHKTSIFFSYPHKLQIRHSSILLINTYFLCL